MKNLCFILLLISSLNTWAQSPIWGILLEKGTRTPLKDVNVYILPYKLKALTNQQGQFEFPEVPAGDFEFIVNNAGYLRLQQKATTENKNYTLYLERELYDVFETTVTGLQEKKDVASKSLSQKDFLKAPGAQEDPVKAVQNLPGVANQSFSAQVVIQGSEPDNTRYTLNGHEIPLVFHFGGLSSIIMPQAVESIDFLASGYGPEFGRALGGIINLRTRPPKKDRWHGMLFVDLYNAGGLAEGAINDKSSVFFSARQSYIGQVLAKVAEGREEFDLTVAPTFSDLFFQYDYQISPRKNFSLIAVKTRDELEFLLKEPIGNDPLLRGDFYQRTEFYRLIPRYQVQLEGGDALDVSLGYGDNDILVEVGDNYFTLDTTTFSQRLEYKKKIHSNATSFLGLDSQLIQYNVGLKFPQRNQDSRVNGDVVLTELEGENKELAIYNRNVWKLAGDKISFSPNWRFAHFSQTDENYLMPRASVSYQADPGLSYHLAMGLYYQAPQNGEATESVGNPDLNSERAIHYNFGLEKDFREGRSNGFVLNLDFFHKKLDQLIINTADLNQDGTPKVYSNQGTGSINGLQGMLKWKQNEWALVCSYTYLQSTRKDPGLDAYPSEFDQTHNLNLIGSYERSRWSFSTRLRYVTGRPYTPIEGAIFDSDNDVYVPLQGDFLSQRYSPFFQLDLRFDRKWIYNNWILSGYLDIQNITNNKNVQSLSYNFDYSEKVETQGLPILPIFGIKGEF